MRDLRCLVRKATSQHGLLTIPQLRAAGVTKSAQATYACQGLFVGVHRGVVRLAGSPTSWEQRVLAAVLATGETAVASHRTALRLWQIRTRFDGVELVTAASSRCTLRDVLPHRSRTLVDADRTVVDAIPVTTLGRTLFDTARFFPPREVGRIVDHAVATGRVTLRELVELTQRLGGRQLAGHARLAAAIDAATIATGSDSGPEAALARLLVNAGLGLPVAQHGVRIGGRHYRLDLCYPDARIAIEYDGYRAHAGHSRFESDRVRQNDLVIAGWTLLRFTARDLRERPRDIVAQVRALLPAPPDV